MTEGEFQQILMGIGRNCRIFWISTEARKDRGLCSSTPKGGGD